MREAFVYAGCFVAVILVTAAIGTFAAWNIDWLRVWEWDASMRFFLAFEAICATVLVRLGLKMWMRK